MTTYALVSPDDEVDRYLDGSKLDLNAGTKPGWRWLPVIDEYGIAGIEVTAEAVYRRKQDPATVPPPVPEVISARQARLALLAAGLLAQVEATVSTADAATQIAWEYATEIQRDDPLVASMAGALGLDAATLDQLFFAAAEL